MKIFLDSGDINEILKWIENPLVQGVTTNLTLMRKAGVKDYEGFAKDILANTDKPVSFEVFSDEWDEMERQARLISSWGKNIYVKIPITNTKGESSVPLIKKLADIKLNITAIMTADQVASLPPAVLPMIISVFAGRIADTGVDPFPQMNYIKKLIQFIYKAELLWASSREVLNIYQAEVAGVNIITCTPDLITKYERLKGKDLTEYSLDTVKQFYEDGKKAGYVL